METIELRRYPSRKLYNKSASKYVKLPDVAELIRAGHNISVEDTETGEDVTRQLLLQLIIEQESGNTNPILSADVLTEMVRAHQSQAASLLTGLFEQSFEFLRTQQTRITSLASPWAAFDPAQFDNLQREFQDRIVQFWSFDRSSARADASAPGNPSPAPDNDSAEELQELQALRDRLDKLEKKLSG